MPGHRHQTDTTEEISFGEQLKALRMQKGLELKAIAEETRIAMSTLALLEESAYERLPDVVFVTGFLRAYAKAVDVTPDILIQNYLAGRHHHLQKLHFNTELLRKKKDFWPRLRWKFFLLTALLALAVIILRVGGPSPSPDAGPEPISTLAPATMPLAAPSPAGKEGYTLGIAAKESTWLKVIIDGASPKQYNLNPGDQMELKAQSGFNLLIGSAPAVTLRLNGKPLPLEGKRGQTVTLKVP